MPEALRSHDGHGIDQLGHGASRPPHAPLPHPGDRKLKLPLPELVSHPEEIDHHLTTRHHQGGSLLSETQGHISVEINTLEPRLVGALHETQQVARKNVQGMHDSYFYCIALVRWNDLHASRLRKRHSR